MLRVESLTLGYGKKDVVKDISFSLKEQSLNILVGENGSGKSTLVKGILGILKAKSGSVIIDNQDIKELKQKEVAKKISYLPQVRVVPNITVKSLVSHGRFPHLSYPRKLGENDKKFVNEAIKITGIEAFSSQNLINLSGGERQKVYIAMLICQDTNIMILDEPTTYLDIKSRKQFWELAKKLTMIGKTVIVITHDILEGLQYADNIMVMDKGSLAIYDSVDVVLNSGVLNDIFEINIVKENDNYIIKNKI